MKIYRLYTILLLLVMGFVSCSTNDIEEIEYGDLFENLADNIIVPRYLKFQLNLSDLNTALNNFDANNMSDLELLQQKFKDTYLSWQLVSAFEFGPAGEYNTLLRTNINSFPTNFSKIEMNIESEDYNLSVASN